MEGMAPGESRQQDHSRRLHSRQWTGGHTRLRLHQTKGILDTYITRVSRPLETISNAPKAEKDASWRAWCLANPDSKITLEDYIRDSGLAATQDSDYIKPRGFGPEARAPEVMRMVLKPHQKQALYWLLQVPPTGKILADDVGLGKTLVILAYTFSIPIQGDALRSALVLVPKPLLQNWYHERRKACDTTRTSCIVAHGQEGVSSNTLTLCTV